MMCASIALPTPFRLYACDADQLARLYRAGELTGLYVPEPEDEAMRDLIRARFQVGKQQHWARQQFKMYLLRHNLRYGGQSSWTPAHLGKPTLKLGLDVHLEFIMAVAQKDHAHPHAPRKFTRGQLVIQVKKWVAEGFQVFCAQESRGFGFVLHRQLVVAGAQSFLITPIALNGQRKTDKLDARALCLRLARCLDGNRCSSLAGKP